MTLHRVAEIHFTPRTNDGPMRCDCGDEMPASEFSNHRKSLGLTTNGNLRVPEELKGKATVWNKSIR